MPYEQMIREFPYVLLIGCGIGALGVASGYFLMSVLYCVTYPYFKFFKKDV